MEIMVAFMAIQTKESKEVQSDCRHLEEYKTLNIKMEHHYRATNQRDSIYPMSFGQQNSALGFGQGRFNQSQKNSPNLSNSGSQDKLNNQEQSNNNSKTRKL
ncbi:UNKNOWN [Stylonychia lemnae]|uniref:Uncharacterized protein n=1 Tax=Stylonychia lemnae TaxID=5949 RepID=A0A078B4Y5_STYLE|nr:UNKNOWN [Stylonychia lemnae]|eukprot:CDW89484.1 UNKNOWN [Stylonychia lemnae]